LVKRKGPLSDKQLAEARKWLIKDWESHDHDRQLIALAGRLLATCDIDSCLSDIGLKIRDSKTGLYSTGG
jgi:hypothetical protein